MINEKIIIQDGFSIEFKAMDNSYYLENFNL